MKKKILTIVGSVALIAGIVLGSIGIRDYLAEENAGGDYEALRARFDVGSMIDIPQVGEGPVEVPIDFAGLKAQYPDIYAWIRIPGTKVDYPILQRGGDNSYYLNHTYDGKKRIEGAIYTEDYNSKDFSDPNTIIYGHNMKNGSMFKSLHKYKDKKFLLENNEVLIYQEGRILRYKIFAAYTYDDRHLMLSFDFKNEVVFRSYINFVLTKKDMSSNIDSSTPVTVKDKIITLSTCENSNERQRYLVQAVLLSIQE